MSTYLIMKSGSKTEAPNSTTHDHYVLHMVHFASHIVNISPLVLDCHIQILTSTGEVWWNLNLQALEFQDMVRNGNFWVTVRKTMSKYMEDEPCVNSH